MNMSKKVRERETKEGIEFTLIEGEGHKVEETQKETKSSTLGSKLLEIMETQEQTLNQFSKQTSETIQHLNEKVAKLENSVVS